MLTIEEIEAACGRDQPPEFLRHTLEAPELTLCERFYPLGFPVELRTNSAAILALACDLWPVFPSRFGGRPIRVDVHVIDSDGGDRASEPCPPAPSVRMTMPLIVSIADGDNWSVGNLEQGWTRMVLARTTERHRSYLGYFFLGSAPLCHIASSRATPIHAGCVAFAGCGMLLCGDSGAGKSSLSYACARAGWTYVTDDASYFLHEAEGITVTGNCNQVRFRPSAGELFPEIAGLEMTPRAAGKPSIEMPTAELAWMDCSATASVRYLVFLNRRAAGAQTLAPYRKDVARGFLRQVLFGTAESLAVQYRALERLLQVEVLELRYSDLEWAVKRLQALAVEGC